MRNKEIWFTLAAEAIEILLRWGADKVQDKDKGKKE